MERENSENTPVGVKLLASASVSARDGAGSARTRVSVRIGGQSYPCVNARVKAPEVREREEDDVRCSGVV